MTGLIPLSNRAISGNKTSTVSARTLHEFLCVGRDFANWMRDRIKQYGFAENHDYIVCSPKRASKTRGGHNAKDYHLTLDMAKELAMVERTEKGREARRYFIECERQLQQRAKALPGPDTGMSQALRHAINRKAHALSLQGFDAIRARLTIWAEDWRRGGNDAHALELIEDYDGLAGDMVFVNAETLAHITKTVAIMQNTMGYAMKQIAALEKETGRRWYNRA